MIHKHLLILLFIMWSFGTIFAQDTFSIIAVDPQTGEIGAAGASCVDGIAQYGGIKLLNRIIPGRGGINAQAYICLNPHINLDNGIQQMHTGKSPQEIIDWLIQNDACISQNYNPQYRQYGIVDMDSIGFARAAAFTGNQADDYKGHLTGSNYAIQGNILKGSEVLEQMEAGFINTNGSLAEKLMAAMKGANIPGADTRCLNRGTSSTSAFLTVFQPGDAEDNPYLLLDILEMPFGEEPIDSLQVLFDDWLSTLNTSDKMEQTLQFKITPNPAKDLVIINTSGRANIKDIRVYDLEGKMVLRNKMLPKLEQKISVSSFTSGYYIFKITDEDNFREEHKILIEH